MAKIVLEVGDERMDELMILMAACKIKDSSELVNNALTLFAWAVRARMEGDVIARLNEAKLTYRDIELQVFKNILAADSDSS